MLNVFVKLIEKFICCGEPGTGAGTRQTLPALGPFR